MANYYLKMVTAWDNSACRHCGAATTGYGQLFKEAPPQGQDTRKVIGEVFSHADKDDCVILADSERPRSG
jgi:hypothetical protein